MTNHIHYVLLRLCLNALRQAIQQHGATYIYDGWNLISQSEISNLPSQIQTNQTWFVWGLELSGSLQGAGGIGGLLSANINGTNLFYSYDANGNITEYITSTGEKSFALAAHYEYDPYGNTIAKTGTSADSNHFRFSTKHFDKDLSLYYYGYRYYNSELGRWINRDPIGEQGGFNVYGFVHNGVLDEYDLLGLRNDKRACCNKNRCT